MSADGQGTTRFFVPLGMVRLCESVVVARYRKLRQHGVERFESLAANQPVEAGSTTTVAGGGLCVYYGVDAATANTPGGTCFSSRSDLGPLSL